MAKRLYSGTQAQRGLASGINLLADAVRQTLGPRGRRVGLSRLYMPPIFSNDGSSIATEFILDDKLANIGVQLYRKVANQMEGDVGDGTTITLLLASELLRQGQRHLAAGAEPRFVTAGLKAATGAACAAIRADSRPLTDLGETAVRRVALMAAHDEIIANLTAEAFTQVGEYGLIEVEPTQAVRSWVEVVPGMVFEQGYITPRLMPGKDGGTVDLKSPFVMVMEGIITDADDLLPALDLVKQRALPLLIVAEEITGEALTAMIINNVRGLTRAFGVRAPGYGGERSRRMLADLAVITGAELLSAQTGYRPDKFHEGMLGRAARAVITEKDTRVVGGDGDQEARTERAQALKLEMAKSRDDYDRETLKQRIGWLSGGVAIMRPGCGAASHVRETRYRAEHALAAVRAALAEGLVVGGGLAYLEGAKAAAAVAADMANLPAGLRDGGRAAQERAMGARMLASSLRVPLRQMAQNAGLDGVSVTSRVESLPPGQGLDLETLEWGDLWERGIVDPTRVVIQSIQKAVSIAALVLESSAVVVDMSPLEAGKSEGA